MAIQRFRHKGLQELFEHGRSRKIGARYAAKALETLDYLDAVAELQDCAGVRNFHALQGSAKNLFMISLGRQRKGYFREPERSVRLYVSTGSAENALCSKA